MVWPAPSPGRSLEAGGDPRPIEMTSLDRTRLTGLLGLSPSDRWTGPLNRLVPHVLLLIQSANPDQGRQAVERWRGRILEGHMRWRSALAVSFSAVLLASACATPGTPGTSPSGSAAGSGGGAAFKRGDGGELKILYWQAPTILNPHQATGTKDSDASRLVIEPLASWGPDAKPVANALAAEIPTVANGGVSADFTTVTWKLKPGLKWSDGSAVTADDVVFTFTQIKDPASASTTAHNTEGVKSVVAKDANTVVLTYDQPNPNFYQWGVGNCCGILQKAQFANFAGAKMKDAPGNLKPIGTGPYMVTDFKPGDVVTYAANPNFRDPNKPFFKTVNFKGGGDAPSSARAVFQTGDVDYGWNLQVESAVLKPMIDSSTKGKMLSVYGSSVERIVV